MTEQRLSPVERRSPHLAPDVHRLVDRGVEFYLASNESLLPHLNLTPYGHHLSWLDFTRTSAPGEWDTGQFLNLFNVINGISFGDRGIPMPQWVMVDLILMPAAALVAGVSQRAFADLVAAAPDNTRPHLVRVQDEVRDSGYPGPMPVGGYCAAPSAAGGTWVGWSLWSLMPGVGLGRVVKALALAAYRTRRLNGVTQYDNTALRVHTRFGMLRVLVATVPFHTSPGSFVYGADLTEPGDSPRVEPTFLLEPTDYSRQRAMQDAIEAHKADFFVLPPGHVVDGGRTVVPVLEVPRAG
jgi:hypothetical protein